MKSLFLLVFMALIFGCGGDNNEIVKPSTEKPTITVNAILPNELKVVYLDIGGVPLKVEITQFWMRDVITQEGIRFDTSYEGTMSATKNYRIKSFDILLETLDKRAPNNRNSDPASSGIYYPEILAKGQSAKFSVWYQTFTDERLYKGFVYKIQIEAQEISDIETKELGINIRNL